MTSISTASKKKHWRNIGIGAMTFFAVAVALIASLPYFVLPIESANTFLAESFIPQKFFVYLHIAGAMVALLLGPFQFINKFRNRYQTIHRWMGRIYLIGILTGGIGGIVIARTSPAGLEGAIGFGMLGLLWLYTGLRAYLSIRAGRTREHRHWMIRNFALTFAAVTLRLYIGIGMAVGLNSPAIMEAFNNDVDAWFLEVYRVVPFACWVPNLIISQVIIDRDNKKRKI